MADLVHCPGVYVIDDVSIDGLIEAVVRGLKLSDLNIGIDIGNSRCGITILIDNTPIIHTTLGLTRAVRLLRRLSRYLRINLMVGTSPGISELVRDFLDLLSGTDIRISMVDEELSNNRKRMLGSKYPYLTTDELDSLTHAYTGLSRF
jgi:RNase H-fold protein (predicted Holliday junction resolvase)